MAWDVILKTETESNWARGTPPAPLPLEFSATERRALKQLENSTREHAVDVIGWARQRGIPVKLSGYRIIYTPAMVKENYEKGRSLIDPGRLSWHSVGRAFHLLIFKPGTRQFDEPAYARVAKYARSKGGEWLGDKKIITRKGPIKDTAHFEYHPDFDIATYRKMPLAQREYKKAQARAARYG
jgi:hypothetical protein